MILDFNKINNCLLTNCSWINFRIDYNRIFEGTMPQNSSDSISYKGDSIITSGINYDHIFGNHSLKPVNSRAIALNKEVLSWPAGVFLVSFILIVLIRVASAKRFLMLFKAYFSLGISRQLMREDYKLNKGSSVLFSINFLLCFAYFLFKTNQFYHFNSYSFNSIIVYFILIFFVLAVYFIKIIGSRIIAGLADAVGEMEEYIFNTFLSTNAIGLFLFPIVVCMEYSHLPLKYLIISGTLVFFLFYTIRVIKGFIIAFVSGRYSIFHLFLYLCALEILPLIVLIKAFMSKFF